MGGEVGADAGHDHAGQLIGQGRHGGLEDGLGGLAEGSAGVASEGDGGCAGLVGHGQGFDGAADDAGDGDADDQVGLGTGLGQEAGGIAAEGQGAEGLGGHTGELVECQFSADWGVVAVAAADEIDAFDGGAGFEVEGAAGGGVEGFDDIADEGGQGVDLLVHGRAVGHGGSSFCVWVGLGGFYHKGG